MSNLYRRRVEQGLDPRSLHLILLPTEKCNFRCTYCYEKFEIGRMKPEIQLAVCRLIEKRKGLRRLHIGWFGGEPLVAFEVVKKISRFSHDYCAQKEIFFSSDMTTNGYLLSPDRADILIRNGINSYQISLDGDEDAHNRTRIRANGRGSFGEIFDNLVQLLSTDWKFQIILRIHYHRQNIESVYRLIDRLGESFAGDTRISFLFKGVGRYGGPNDDTFPVVDSPEERRKIERIFFRRAGDYFDILDVQDVQKKYICYACKGNSLIVRSDGTLSKCTVALYDERNTVGKLNFDGTISLNQSKFRRWVQPLITGSNADRSCPARSVLGAYDS